MKHKNIFIKLLILIAILGTLCIIFWRISHPTWDKVYISIEDGSLNYTGATLIIKNKNFITTNYSFTDNFYIDKNINGQWINIPDKSTIKNHLPLASVPHIYKVKLNWQHSHGELSVGTYRLRFEPKSYLNNISYNTTITIEFTINEILQ